MEKQIILSIEKKKELAAIFRCSRQTIWAALRFHTNSPVANKIRKAAYECGGVLIGDTRCPDGVAPYFETTFHIAEKLMIQTFTDRVKLIAELDTGTVKIYADNEVVETRKNVLITDLLDIQKSVQHIANQLK